VASVSSFGPLIDLGARGKYGSLADLGTPVISGSLFLDGALRCPGSLGHAGARNWYGSLVNDGALFCSGFAQITLLLSFIVAVARSLCNCRWIWLAPAIWCSPMIWLTDAHSLWHSRTEWLGSRCMALSWIVAPLFINWCSRCE